MTGTIMNIDPKTLDEMAKVSNAVVVRFTHAFDAFLYSVEPVISKLREFGIPYQEYVDKERRKERYLRRYQRRGERMRKRGHK